MSVNLRFNSRDSFDIPDRGVVYIVDLPDELWRDSVTPSLYLIGRAVWIDGESYRVRGVEMPAIPWKPASPTFKTVGLLVRD